MKKYLSLFLLLVITVAMLAGCANTTLPETSTVPSSSTAPDNTPEATDDAASTRMVTDSTGTQIEIPAKVERVCSAIAAYEEMFLLLGAGDKNIIGNQWNKDNAWFVKLQPEIANLPSVFETANEVNMETLLGLEPDVAFVGSPDLRDSLIEAGIPAVAVSIRSMDDIVPTINLVAEVLGDDAPDIAASLIAEHEANLQRVTAITDGIAKEDRPTVFYAANNTLNTEGIDSIVTSWIEIGGGINIAAEKGIEGAFVDVTIEDLLEWDPDVIVCRDYSHYKEYMSDPRFATLSAVKNERVHTNPTGAFVWCARGADEVLQVVWAPTVIQPELFADVDIDAYVKDFYTKYYKYDPTPEEIQDILFPTQP